MSPQVTAGTLIPADAPIDRFVTDAQRAVLFEHAGNLFGAPFSTQQPCYERHIFDREVRSPTTSPASCHCVAVRFLGAVLAIVVGRIAPQFAADRAAVAPEKLSDVRLRAAAHELRGNRVSFFLGELVIRHGCNPFPGRMERRQYHWLPTLVQRVLHLLCESARPNHAYNRTRTLNRFC